MPKRSPSADVRLDVTAGEEKLRQAPDSETPFRILILGDFSGRANRGLMETGEVLASRSPVLIDRDNFDTVLRKLSPHLNLPLEDEGGLRLELKFSDLDDFHPDALFSNSTLFQKLRGIREKLDDPDTFAATAMEFGLVAATPSREDRPPERPQHVSAADVQQITSGSLLDQMVESTEERTGAPSPSRAPDEWTSLVNRILAPHLVPKADPRQAELIGLIDKAIGAQMRALLHTGAYQQLEAAWRSLLFLVRNLETDTHLKLFLIDISKQEMATDLGSSHDLTSTATYRQLVEKTTGTPGAETWTLIVGNFAFGPTREDAELLRRIGKVAAAAGAPFVSSASPDLLGCNSVQDLPDPRRWKTRPDNEVWQALRAAPESNFIGLLLPRFLLRVPYGKETEATERFPFEEVSDGASHEEYLWGNPAFLCAFLLGQTFSEQGWNLCAGTKADVSGLPLYVYTERGEPRTLPCAEVLTTQSAAETILENGLMPLASLKDQDVVRIVRFQSIADPLAPLAGPWTT